MGNSPDALELISNHGADGVRVGLLLSSAAGNDLSFEGSSMSTRKNFANKIWNAFRLIQGFELSETIEQPVHSAKGVFWFQQKFNAELKEIEQLFELLQNFRSPHAYIQAHLGRFLQLASRDY